MKRSTDLWKLNWLKKTWLRSWLSRSDLINATLASGPLFGTRAGASREGGGCTPGNSRASTSAEDGIAGTILSGGAEVAIGDVDERDQTNDLSSSLPQTGAFIRRAAVAVNRWFSLTGLEVHRQCGGK